MQLRSKSYSWIVVLIAAVVATGTNRHAAAQEKAVTKKSEAKAPPRPEMVPIQDVAGLPRVLLIGDTVSVGYTLPTRKLLEGKANVHRVLSNAGSSQLGSERIAEWLGTERWDLIHFNFGVYDLAISKEGQVEVPPDRYEANLRMIIGKLRSHSPNARLVFATTTPFPEAQTKSQYQFSTKDFDAYAKIADKVMKDAGVHINDLYSLVNPRRTELQIPENLHFRAAGWELMGKKVADEIEIALKTPAPAPTTVKASGDKGLRVFTCGHSFHVWVVPLLSELAMNAGIVDHQIAGLSSIGGSTVLKHWNVPDEMNKAKQALRAGNVDVLTLSPIWLPDEGIENFATLAVQANPNIRITVQKYWLPNDEYVPVYPLETKKKVDHNATTIPTLRKAQDQYDHDVDEYVRALNTKLGTNALVTVPVGQAVIALREKIIAGEAPGLKMQSELFRDNWGHPTQPIQALAAYCHYAVIYKRSPVGLPRLAILARNSAWDDNLNRLLQELAWEAVLKNDTAR